MPSRRPESAGPTTVPTWMMICIMAKAAESCRRSTMPGTEAMRAVLEKPIRPAARELTTYSTAKRGVGHGGVDGHGTTRQRHGSGGPHHDLTAVHRVADRTGVERSDDERDQLGQADGAHLQGRPRHGVHLVRNGHHGELRPQHGDELAGEEQSEVAALAQRGGVHEDPARHGSSLRSARQGAAGV